MSKDVIIEEIAQNRWGEYVVENYYYCPNCRIRFEWNRVGFTNKFCYNCGQKLNWDIKRSLI